MAKKIGLLGYNKKPLIDLTKSIKFVVSEQNCRDGKMKNAEECPGALGFKETGKLKGKLCKKAEFHRYVIYIDFGGEYSLRGYASPSLQKEIIVQDRGGNFAEGEYEIKPVPKSEVKRRGKAHSVRPSKHPRPYKTKRYTKHIRDFALSSENVGRI